MTQYATISVPEDIKKALDKAKGEREWGEFLLELYAEAKRLRSRKAFEELTKALTSRDLEAIRKSSRQFREKFALR